MQLNDVAHLASWPKPKVATGDYCYSSGDHAKPVLNLNGVAKLTIWATPTSRDHKDGSYTPNVEENALLGRQVWQVQATWASPQARDHRSVTGREPEQRDNPWQNLNVQAALLPSGPTATGSPAETAKPGQLNPAHSLYLMGYNHAWLLYSPLKRKEPKR